MSCSRTLQQMLSDRESSNHLSPSRLLQKHPGGCFSTYLINKRRAEKSIIIPLAMAQVFIVTDLILIKLGELCFMGIISEVLEKAFLYDTQEKWVM